MREKICFIQVVEIIFMAIGTYFDIKSKELPTIYLLSFVVVSSVCNILCRYQKIGDIILGISIGILIFFLGWITREAIGYGDAFGIMILGSFMGFPEIFWTVFGAFVLSGIYGFGKVLCKKANGRDTIPFFPFLFLALIGGIVL